MTIKQFKTINLCLDEVIHLQAFVNSNQAIQMIFILFYFSVCISLILTKEY